MGAEDSWAAVPKKTNGKKKEKENEKLESKRTQSSLYSEKKFKPLALLF